MQLYFLDRIFKKSWSDAEVQKYAGTFESAFLTHAALPQIRTHAASGGTVSALLIHGLQNALFDGALVCRSEIVNGKVRAQFFIARTEGDILEAQGSKYVETEFMREAMPLIQKFTGKLAVVGLPCDISNLMHTAARQSELQQKIVLTIALFCGHNSRHILVDQITSEMEQKAGSRITHFRFRTGHWRGRTEAHFENGLTVTQPASRFTDYQNLFFFAEPKCIACYDHYGYNADICAGDVWLYRLREDPVKHTGLIIRNARGRCTFESALKFHFIEAQSVDIRTLLDGQSRIGPFHYNVSARACAGRLLGITLNDPLRQRVKWHQWMSAWLSLFNMRISEKGLGQKIIFSIPRPLLKAYLYLKKFLEALK